MSRAYDGLRVCIAVAVCQACDRSTAGITARTDLIYHGVATHRWSRLVTPGDGHAAAIATEVRAYEAAAGRTVAWIEVAHEWHAESRAFPTALATSIRNRGATPLIFLNLREVDLGPSPTYALAKIVAGEFDEPLTAWADGAKAFGSELMVNWGWEMNGDWTPWNGAYNGGEVEGPRRFRNAYRHIAELMRRRGATNIRFGFHVDVRQSPEDEWNAFEKYYPGDDVIDGVGLSIFGAQSPTDEAILPFIETVDAIYARLVALAPTKPVFIFELATTPIRSGGSQVRWADEALAAIFARRWPAVRGFAWWNDAWQNDAHRANDTEMRVEAVPGLSAVFRARLSSKDLGDRGPVFSW